jgi:alkanesulfonate monooxygenase SsuD/methylene tetrahydromethanopterin reductase-like flavin-dependent oxidoreductase (luciferase family)
MDKGLAVSVLDLVGMRPGEPAGSAIARSVGLAQHVEQLGYKRYWLAELHKAPGTGERGVTQTAPSILLFSDAI